MIHRFVDLQEDVVPDIPFVAYDGAYTIWQLGNLATPRAITVARVSSSSGDWVADPMRSPVQDDDGIPVEFVYCKVRAGTGPVNELIVVDWEGTNADIITTSEGNNGTRGLSTSLQPAWSPDGQQIVWTDTVADHVNADEGRSICVIDRDGSNETILLTGAQISTPTYAESDDFWNPQYSYDGSKIAFVREKGITDTGTPSNSGTHWTLEVMNADGTGVQIVDGPRHDGSKQLMDRNFAWANTSLVLAFMTFDGSLKTDDQYWRKVNSDATGAAVVWQIDRSARTTFDYDPRPQWSWLSDDSAIVTALRDFGGTDLWDLVLLDPAGTGPTTLIASAMTEGTDIDNIPVAIGGRIYFPTDDTPITMIDSVLEDGTDRRTDLNAEADFDGFRGDNLS